jgi:CrcB protein
MTYLYVFLGAGLGGILRFFCSSNLQRLSGLSFPLGTFFVNMSGCLLIGFIAQLAETRAYLSGDVRAFLVVGILGGYTTFSSFGYETLSLIRSGEVGAACLNAFGQLALGLFCVWLGSLLARLLNG